MPFLIFAIFLFFGSVLTLIRAHWLWVWMLRIALTEWSWVLLLMAIAVVIFAGGGTNINHTARIIAAIAAIIYFLPLIQAVRVAIRDHIFLKMPVRSHVAFERIAIGDRGQHLDFYPSQHSGIAPCVVVVHGGGWQGGDTQELSALNSILAKNGYAVASVSYRLAPESEWPVPYEDVVGAIQFLRAKATRFKIDPDDLILLGRSAGGQLAAVVAVHKAVPGIRGCICFYAPLDMEFAYQTGREDDLLKSRQLLRNYLGGTLETAPRAYREASPILYVTQDTVPFLLIHGTRDELVWARHSQRFAGELQKHGVKYRHLEFPWSTHALDFPPLGLGRMLSTSAVLDFLQDVCKKPAAGKTTSAD
ncbi:MAG: alpha/beta hydrolase [Chthoniobacterales bacterium]